VPAPLGPLLGCAAAAAQSVAGSQPWGLVVLSDAPALRCLVEASPLAAAGRVLVTPMAPGSTLYAPGGHALQAAGLTAVVDHYLMTLLDVVLPLTASAFTGTSSARRFLPDRYPPGSELHGPGAPGGAFEQWFDWGRENMEGLAHVPDWLNGPGEAPTLRLLSATHAGCPVTAQGAAEMLQAYLEAERRGNATLVSANEGETRS